MIVPKTLNGGGLALATAMVFAACTSTPPAPEFPREGTLRVGFSSVPITDPHALATFDVASSMVIEALCDNVVGIDSETGRLTPALAKNFTSTDRGRAHFFLMDDPDQIAKSLSSLAHADTASPSAELLSSVDGYKEIRNEVDAERARDANELRGIRTSGGIEILLSEDRGDFARVLATTPTAVTPCNGPFRMESPTRFVKNLDSPAKASVDAVEIQVFETASEALSAFDSQSVDLTYWDFPEPAPPSARVIAALGVEYIGFPATQSQFDEPATRIALNRALASAPQLPGLARAKRFFPPSLAGSWHSPKSCEQNFAPSDTTASTSDFELTYNEEFTQGVAIAEHLTEATGATITASARGFADYLPTGTGQFESPFRFAFQSMTPSAFELARAFSTGGEISNLTGFSDPSYDDAFRNARRALTFEDQQLAYQRVEELLCELMPVAPLNFGGRAFLINDQRITAAKGPLLNESIGYPQLRNLRRL